VEELSRRDEVLLAVVESHWQPSLAQDRCWRKSDLTEPYPKGVRDFKTVWHVTVIFSLAGIFVLEAIALSGHSSVSR